MKRDLYGSLLAWKNLPARKPLILRGARQVGKTYLLKEFGRQEYKDTAYFNFEQDPGLAGFFHGKLDPALIVQNLSLYSEKAIVPGRSLIVFDEIQNCPEALNSLKYFQEQAPEHHVAAAGSLLGLKVGKSTAFPVGKVAFLDLHPMSFGEFLEATGHSGLRKIIESRSAFDPLESAFHQALLHDLRLYYYVGGMPEAVALYAESRDLKRVRRVQDGILEAHIHDFAKHTTKTEAVRLGRIWDAVPGQLAKENKKFRYADVAKHARARDYTESLQWLADAGLVLKCHNIKCPKLPLSGYREDDAFKIYLLDVGLLGTRLGLTERTIVEGDRLFSEYSGAFVENYVAQELVTYGCRELYYWTSASQAEVDFIVGRDDAVYPLEVKAGASPKKKSLTVYAEKFAPHILSRATTMNFKKDGGVCNYPLYAVSRFPDLGRATGSTVTG